MEGQTLSHYKVLEKLGGGGMGVVYKALDTHLDRHVALKLLPPELTRDDDARERFVLEAKAASALDHPNICTIYDIDETPDGQMFIAMGFYDGETLKKRIEHGPLPVEEALDIAIQVAQGLDKAHQSDIVHRDIKPANIMLTKDGLVKIVDFGIAKLLGVTGPTQTGTTLGTVSYMSPEQIAGEDADQQSDVWSLGAVLYEMLTGQQPFKGETAWAVMNAISTREPQSLAQLNKDVSSEVEQVVGQALQKLRDRRFSSAVAFLAAATAHLRELTQPVPTAPSPSNSWQRLLTPTVVVPVLLMLLIGGFGWSRLATRDEPLPAGQALLPEIERLFAADDFAGAFRAAEQAQEVIPDDPQLEELWTLVASDLTIETTPPGADIFVREYSDTDGEWARLGQSPIEEERFPQGVFHLRVESDGYETLESAIRLFTQRGTSSFQFRLSAEGSLPSGMVPVQGGPVILSLQGLNGAYGMIPLPDFMIDRFEVTNRQYKAFVDADGYERPDYWTHEFSKDGRSLSFEEAMTEFTDVTGQPGPSTWSVGIYPDGHADHPVSGVSWHEAAAYAVFVGRKLPTLYHWDRAAGIGAAASILPQSNFGEEVAPVGSYAGVSRFGAYDMAGNVREWVATSAAGGQYLLGGGWNDPEYLFSQPSVRSASDRSAANGFRTASYERVDPTLIPEHIPLPNRDYGSEQPVSDEVFEAYRDRFLYDERDLNARTEDIDETPEHWRKEKITFDAVYDDDRVTAYLFLPKTGTPPYQTVVLFPGAGDVARPSSDDLGVYTTLIEFLPISGRAVLYPIYKGTYERKDAAVPFSVREDPVYSREDRAFTDSVTMVVQDFMRSVDYLETRDDIDTDKFAYFGYSWGGLMANIVPAIEPRLKAVVVALAGLPMLRSLPEVDAINFVTRVTTPVLMLNGQHDFIFPTTASQVPMFELLGTPDEHKRRVVFEDAGHDLFPVRQNSLIRETLAWLDKYLGPVN